VLIGSAPPFSGVVGSGRGCGVNVSYRVIRAGYTNTRRVCPPALRAGGAPRSARPVGGHPNHLNGGRPCPPERWREYLDAILYVLRTEGFPILNQIALLPRRLDRSQLFDTL